MIQVGHLHKIIDQRTTLDIDELIVANGEIHGVVGSHGSGLDTLFNLLIGKTRPSAGTILFDKIEPLDKPAFTQKVGILFAEDGLYHRQTAEWNLALPCRLYGMPRDRVREVLEQIGMTDQASSGLAKMPPGHLRRLAFGRAILHRPDTLILYEPFARCDEASIVLLSRLIRQLAKDGAAILILAADSTHLEPVIDNMYQLHQGRLVSISTDAEQVQQSYIFKIPVRTEDKVILVNPGEILYIEADSGHSCLKTSDARLITQFTLNELEDRLSRSGFFRAHRSYLVNLQHIKEIIPYTRNSYTLRLNDAQGTQIPLSKAAAAELKDLYNY